MRSNVQSAAQRGRLILVAHGAPKPALTPTARLAPFERVRPIAAILDAGLAVFDAIPAKPAGRLSLPTIARGTIAGSHPLPLTVSEARPGRRCPSCGWMDVRRSIAHHAKDHLLSVVGLVPYRCRTCDERFHRLRLSGKAAAIIPHANGLGSM